MVRAAGAIGSERDLYYPPKAPPRPPAAAGACMCNVAFDVACHSANPPPGLSSPAAPSGDDHAPPSPALADHFCPGPRQVMATLGATRRVGRQSEQVALTATAVRMVADPPATPAPDQQPNGCQCRRDDKWCCEPHGGQSTTRGLPRPASSMACRQSADGSQPVPVRACRLLKPMLDAGQKTLSY